MITSSSSLNLRSNRRQEALTVSRFACASANAAESVQPPAASDLVNHVLERSQVFGCGIVNKSVNRNVNILQAVLTFPACSPRRPLLKQFEAATGLQCREECFSSAVHRMNILNFTRREIRGSFTALNNPPLNRKDSVTS
jgi:hypothetical protein